MKRDKVSRLAAFFGYGSLVNELTWGKKYHSAPGKIANWVREWKHCVQTPYGRVCALTVSRQKDSILDGVFIACTSEEVELFDKREIGYIRTKINRSDFVEFPESLPDEVFIYSSSISFYRDGCLDYPIWLSYAHSVLHGYLRTFGETGVDRFIKSTKGWLAPVLDDRKKPLYPRATEVSPEIRSYINKKLSLVIARDF